MAEITQNQSFHARLRAFEAQHARKRAAEGRPRLSRVVALTFLRLVAVLPVWLVLLKGVTLARMGVPGYQDRLAELSSGGGMGELAMMAMQIDILSLTVARIILGA
jgi:hypothetical protein